MKLNTDVSQRVVIKTEDLAWVKSPTQGVSRQFLARDGEENAVATSIVRYEKNAQFSPHEHPLGEEIFVLQGDFNDEFGYYPQGSYIKNPAGTKHTPFSHEGCTLFVKLRQLSPQDQERIVIKPSDHQWQQGMVSGLKVLSLSHFEASHTALVKWAPNTYFNPHRHFGGEEIFVIDGTFQDEFGSYPKGTWLRSPHMSQHCPFSKECCLILVKTGYLI